MGKSVFTKKRIIIFLAIALVGTFIFGFFTVNSKFPASKKTIHPYGQPFTYQNAKLQIKGKEILDYNQFSNNDDLLRILNIDSKSQNSDTTKIILITVEFCNPTAKTLKLDLTAFHLESGSFSLQFDYPLMLHYNHCGMNLKLNGNEKKTLSMPVPLTKINFSESEWLTINNRKFSVVYSLYPEKNIAETERV